MSRSIPTRWSHLLDYSGVGALMRAGNVLYVVKDTRYWTDRQGEPAGEPIPYVDQIRATLAIEHELRRPPLARMRKPGVVEGTCVPAWRFPGWTRCPSCGLLHWLPWRRAQTPGAQADALRCTCGGRARLQQVAWVLAHPEGGLAEAPWHRLAHLEAGSAGDCREDRQRQYLRMQRDRETALGWYLRCDRCGACARFQPDWTWTMRNPRMQPWLVGDSKGYPDVESTQKARLFEVNDARLYFPRTIAALVIPPESRIERGGVLDHLYCNRGDRLELEQCRTALGRKALLRRLADRYACSVSELESAWSEIERGWPLYGQPVTPGEMSSKEFRALTEPIPDLDEGEDFVPRHQTDAWRALRSARDRVPGERALLTAVDRLVAVNRLREVRIFKGFSRVAQNFDDGLRPGAARGSDPDEPLSRLVPPDLVGNADWLPAIELFGEGIFFTLEEGLVSRWAQQPGLVKRAEILQRRFERTGMRFPDDPPLPLTPRFVLLHTLAHLLIRRLEAQAGYSAASIRERLYCAEGPEPMAGVLVYVAVADVVGSLGGLAELAAPTRFVRLLASVFEHADWCSLDPVCAEHQGQGPSLLNLAACHACALVPEPSCVYGNVLLDRTFLKGDLNGDIQGLLAFAGNA